MQTAGRELELREMLSLDGDGFILRTVIRDARYSPQEDSYIIQVDVPLHSGFESQVNLSVAAFKKLLKVYGVPHLGGLRRVNIYVHYCDKKITGFALNTF